MPQNIKANAQVVEDIDIKENDQLEEIIVIVRANAVVEPVAVMVEFLTAPVAVAAMLSSAHHETRADRTSIFVPTDVEVSPRFNCFLLFIN